MFFTRRRNYRILGKRKDGYHESYLDPDSGDSSENLLWYDPNGDDTSSTPQLASKQRPKRRRCLGVALHTPNTSRFSDNIHSRLLQKFPFLIEMFYWIITYLFYRMTKVLSQALFDRSIIDVAQRHGLSVLEFEQFSWANALFPWTEHDVQHWFMDGHQTMLTFLNRAYALIHIPGTVGYVLPSSRKLSRSTSQLTHLQQLHRMVLLHRPLPLNLRHHPPHPHPHQSLRLPDLHLIPLHASSPPPPRIRFPRLRPPRQSHFRLDERRLRQLPRCDALDAFRLRLRHRLYHDLSFWNFPSDPGKGGDEEGSRREIFVLCHRSCVPEYDSLDRCGDGESLLVGCHDGDDCRLRGILLQYDFSFAVAG